MWKTRALELNNQEFWNWEKTCELIQWAERHDFNTIIVGQTDLFDKLVSLKGFTPHQYNDRLSAQQRARCVYLNRLAIYCQQRNLKFYLQAKEFSFPADLLIAHPQILDKNGNIQFDEEFWCQYLTDKLTLLCQKIPAISGLLVALSNTDGLLPISPPHWDIEGITPDPHQDSRSLSRYTQCFSAMAHAVIREHKHLVLRAFPASNHDTHNIMDAICTLPNTVSVSIKLTPERFWPMFPNNPVLLNVEDRDVWVEIDLMGEEVGWGIFPFPRIDELQGRLLWCRSNPNINGAVCKATWEGVDNHWVMGTLSECNLVACSQILVREHEHVTINALLIHWLDESYGWHPDDVLLEEFQSLMEQAAQVLYQSIYVRNHVFHRHSQVPESYGQAVWSLYGQLNRNHWLPGSERDIYLSTDDLEISRQNLSLIAQEKDDAYQAATQLRQQALAFAQRATFPATLYHRWQEEWQGFDLYCLLFRHAQKAFFTLHFARLVENSWSMREICQVNIQELYRCAVEMESFCAQYSEASPGLHVMFDPTRIRMLADSLEHELRLLKG